MTAKAQHIIEKLGFITDVSKHKFGTQDQLYNASLTQPLVKRYLKLLSPENRKKELAKDKEHFRQTGAGGTIQYSPSGTKTIWVSKELENPKRKRELQTALHHEAFHAQVPVLGQSEVLAQIYGGMRSGNPFHPVYNPVSQYMTGWVARPGRFAVEHALAAGTIYGGKKLYDLIKRLKK